LNISKLEHHGDKRIISSADEFCIKYCTASDIVAAGIPGINASCAA